MTKTTGSKTKKKIRSKRVGPEKLETPKIPEEIIAWEDEGGSVPEKPVDKIEMNPKALHRKQQWDSLDEFSKLRTRMTEEEFLVAEDVTGFGPNSYFTPLEER